MMLMAFLFISLFSFFSCSGCEKQKPASKPPKSKFSKGASFSKTTPKVKTPAPATKADTAKSKIPPKEAKEKILRIMPEVADIFKSDKFKERLQEASRSKDIRGFLSSMKDALSSACEKEGLDFESCMKLINDHKDDKEVRESIAKWRDKLNLGKPK